MNGFTDSYTAAYAELSQSTARTAETLEALIDATSLRNVLTILSEVCEAKALHVSLNWQDDKTAKCWTQAADAINKAHTVAYAYGKL